MAPYYRIFPMSARTCMTGSRLFDFIKQVKNAHLHLRRSSDLEAPAAQAIEFWERPEGDRRPDITGPIPRRRRTSSRVPRTIATPRTGPLLGWTILGGGPCAGRVVLQQPNSAGRFRCEAGEGRWTNWNVRVRTRTRISRFIDQPSSTNAAR